MYWLGRSCQPCRWPINWYYTGSWNYTVRGRHPRDKLDKIQPNLILWRRQVLDYSITNWLSWKWSKTWAKRRTSCVLGGLGAIVRQQKRKHVILTPKKEPHVNTPNTWVAYRNILVKQSWILTGEKSLSGRILLGSEIPAVCPNSVTRQATCLFELGL